MFIHFCLLGFLLLNSPRFHGLPNAFRWWNVWTAGRPVRTLLPWSCAVLTDAACCLALSMQGLHMLLYIFEHWWCFSRCAIFQFHTHWCTSVSLEVRAFDLGADYKPMTMQCAWFPKRKLIHLTTEQYSTVSQSNLNELWPKEDWIMFTMALHSVVVDGTVTRVLEAVISGSVLKSVPEISGSMTGHTSLETDMILRAWRHLLNNFTFRNIILSLLHNL